MIRDSLRSEYGSKALGISSEKAQKWPKPREELVEKKYSFCSDGEKDIALEE
jgi:hypothetical protein